MKHDFLEYLAKRLPCFMFIVSDEILYLEPIRSRRLSRQKKIVAYRLDGTRQEINRRKRT